MLFCDIRSIRQQISLGNLFIICAFNMRSCPLWTQWIEFIATLCSTYCLLLLCAARTVYCYSMQHVQLKEFRYDSPRSGLQPGDSGSVTTSAMKPYSPWAAEAVTRIPIKSNGFLVSYLMARSLCEVSAVTSPIYSSTYVFFNMPALHGTNYHPL